MQTRSSPALRRSDLAGQALGLAALLAAALLLLALLAPGRAEAATTSCSAFSSGGIIFSPYDSVAKTAVDGVGTISFTCTGTGTDTLNIIINGGNAGVCSPRQMRNGTPALNYDLFREAARTSIWCDGSSRHDVPMDYSANSTQTMTITVYGRVTAGQTPTYGSYSDSLSMQLKQGGGVLRTATLSVSGSVSATCSVTAAALSFPSYNGTGAATASSNLSINCSSGAGYQVSLGAGQYFSSTRRMLGPSTNYLSYELHRDSARTLTWGDGSTLGGKLSGTGTGSAQSIPVYGRIPASQYRAVGSYSDSVVVTVEY
jgi:spore coat protein U-like protein